MAKFGNANIAVVPIELDDDYHLTFPRNPTFMGFMERRFHIYDCADFPNNAAPTGITVPIKILGDVPNKLGGTDRLATHRQFNRFRTHTGFKTYTDAAKIFEELFDDEETPFPAPAFKPIWNNREKVEIRYRPIYQTCVVRVSNPGARAYGPRLFALAIPISVYFMARIRGYCSETTKRPPRGIVLAKGVEARPEEGIYWDVLFKNQTNRDKKNPFYKRVYTSPTAKRRFDEVKRFQLRGIPQKFH